MAEPSNLKRRLLYVPEDEAHLVGNKQFAKLNQKVVGILDFATNQIVNEMDKFLETQESLKLQAIIEPNNWRQLRADKHQDAHRMRSKLRSVSMTVDRVESRGQAKTTSVHRL
jgi:hypothetical protein